jgi:hypothetical protein
MWLLAQGDNCCFCRRVEGCIFVVLADAAATVMPSVHMHVLRSKRGQTACGVARQPRSTGFFAVMDVAELGSLHAFCIRLAAQQVSL